MQSLRTRRPSESQQRGNKLSKPPQRDATRKTTRVDDKIRKRMSMRYADISSPTNVDGVPPVPALPIGTPLTSAANGLESAPVSAFTPAEDSRFVELRLLDNDEFDADAFLKLKLANSTEAELKTLQSSLQSQKEAVAVDLQHDVFKNYEEFVQVSKEVGVLENEMLEFKELLADWKSMPSLLHIEESSSVADRRRNVRSSVADLRVLYANQIQQLHAQIEGSSKFVPTMPGRHVVTELDRIMALNPATYKVDHTVRFVVLDDAVLVARRRRRRNNAESDKLVAERCWPLNEMLVLDTKDTSTMSNVFKIRHGKETHVYRTEAPGDKRHLLHQFRQVAEELSAKRRKEREGEHLRRKSLWASDRNSMAYADAPPSPPAWMAEMLSQELGSNAKEKLERDARFITDFSDDLTVAISVREWDKAVTLVEQGEANLPTMPALAAKLNPLKASLTAALLQSLSMPTNRKTMVVTIISLLVRLKAGAAARSTFLAVRSDLLRKRIRMIRFEGHIPLYISDLAIVVFTNIKHTADWFLASFRENEVASCFVEWARKEMEVYAEMFRKQVYSSDIDQETIDEAIEITHIQSRKLLEEYGIDFRFLLDRILVEAPKEPAHPPAFKSRTQKEPSPTHTPAPMPVRTRSPAQPAAAAARSPVPPVPPLPDILPPAPAPRIVSPTPRVASAVSTTSRAATPTSRIRGSPAPPPRSRDRPGSAAGHRPPPVAIPRREGMF